MKPCINLHPLDQRLGECPSEERAEHCGGCAVQAYAALSGLSQHGGTSARVIKSIRREARVVRSLAGALVVRPKSVSTEKPPSGRIRCLF